MPEPLQIYPPLMFLAGMLMHWPLSDNGFPPPSPFSYALLKGVQMMIVGLPSDRARLYSQPKELSNASER